MAMSPESEELNREFHRIIAQTPELARLFPRSPNERYWTDDRGWRYGWTTERMGDSKFAAFVYKPTGRGSRSGKATSFKLVRELHFRKRSTAKERARRWLNRACGRTAA